MRRRASSPEMRPRRRRVCADVARHQSTRPRDEALENRRRRHPGAHAPMGWNDCTLTTTESPTSSCARPRRHGLFGHADFGYQYVNIDDCWMVKPTPRTPSWAAHRAMRPAPSVRTIASQTCGARAYIHSHGSRPALHVARTPDLRGLHGSFQHKESTPGSSPSGASISSSTIGAPIDRGDGKTLADYELPYKLMAGSCRKWTVTSSSTCAIRHGGCLNWAAMWADTPGAPPDLGLEKARGCPLLLHPVQECEHAASAARPLERSGLHPDRLRRDAFHIDAPAQTDLPDSG